MRSTEFVTSLSEVFESLSVVAHNNYNAFTDSIV
jgi:hypothetical protein